MCSGRYVEDFAILQPLMRTGRSETDEADARDICVLGGPWTIVTVTEARLILERSGLNRCGNETFFLSYTCHEEDNIVSTATLGMRRR